MIRSILPALLFLVSLQSTIFGQDLLIDGRIRDIQTQKPIVGAEVIWHDQGTISDLAGQFQLAIDRGDSIRVRMIGYKTLSRTVNQSKLDLYLHPQVLEGQSIDVTASRVIPGITPVAYSTLRQNEIKLHYANQDVPMVLSSEPGVYAYSESGNGTGYSYVSIRGFDQSRIAVMLDNVPLNDNESHQVYWVDHGDILSDASDVEIQRGVGNSLYGATAFGGSININTSIRSTDEKFNLEALLGSYDSQKFQLAYRSGQRLGEHLSLGVRASALDSDGYRQDSSSRQRSLALGLEYRTDAWTHQMRVLIGEAVSVLQWDGITQTMLDDAEKRTLSLPWTVPFTDNFLQQIYSLNSSYRINDRSLIRNVAYLVMGSGYYEVQKYGVDTYQYNLDVNDIYTDDLEANMTTDLMRKKWIQNRYFGVVPVWTRESKRLRTDIGLELRSYSGDHFGEVSMVSDSLLRTELPETYRYYDYTGSKVLNTAFAHLLYRLNHVFSVVADVQAQKIDWQLDQQVIGHAPGLDLSAGWQFINPRAGLNIQVTEDVTLYGGVGRAQKEPADAQIIEADDVWSTPVDAPVEDVVNYELGLNWFQGPTYLNLNLYHIDFQNEVLQDIYDFEEGQFSVESAEHTIHQGFEFDLGSQLGRRLQFGLNGSLARFKFEGGAFDQNHLPNVPGSLANVYVTYQLTPLLEMGITGKHVGQQYIDYENSEDLRIPPYQLLNMSLNFKRSMFEISAKINNILDEKYATYGYAWGEGYYWPGATRNYSLNIIYSFQ